ncbi:MAG: aminomethyl-transferring glycine dehydrogenase [Proteobacteria bacterium]|nr:aminomethyl-transferring glycine dehydrogenase [Pseudomonadota bacterium]MCL2309106.1 aminomethyl-transferring glycine dehydrogenase [Pseudomonadota bacterium]
MSHTAFAHRHIGTTATEQAEMLDAIGVSSRAALMNVAVPKTIRSKAPPAVPAALSEEAALAQLRAIADKNVLMKSFIGQGYYGTHMPSVLLRNILENPAWYTAYTPYQPEISQGRLEALLTFQTMVCDLTGMDIANASMLDEATAAAEAMTLALRSVDSAGSSKSMTFFVADDVFRQTRDVILTRAAPLGIRVVVGPASAAANTDAFAALVQIPAADGGLHDYKALADAVHARDGKLIVAADLLALTLIEAPGVWGADIVVGSAQRFGVPMGYGGPHAGFLATRDALKRSMPGRLVGISVDAQGAPAYRLALQTREQHIRREKATSNICTAQVLLAVLAGMYAVYHGPHGLRAIATRIHHFTGALKAALIKLDAAIVNTSFFDTLTITPGGGELADLHASVRKHGMNFREIDSSALGVSLDETTTAADLETILEAFSFALSKEKLASAKAALHATLGSHVEAIPLALQRKTPYLQHPVFNRYHTETEMLRYLRRLADKDLALDRTMIPLGSCTMKLNATSEMLPITWPQFAELHPFAPKEQAQGYRTLIDDLAQRLCAITGYDAFSLQPNSGAQGEYAGLIAIRAYHASRGDAQRSICLIPTSAHGTNPASAHMAGMQVVAVRCDSDGNIDLVDLEARAAEHADTLAAAMITYPSTHGVFETTIRKACEIVHRYGGQVYIDGANLNALVGLAAPGDFGADVSHLNLHKTFAIPHGGGGPGVGPVGVKKHLAPFLPGHRMLGNAAHVVSAAPFGSASVLPISWMYLAMMGPDGLTAASEAAILSANYIARKLKEHYPILYTGADGYVAHECILDLRPLKASADIEAEDVAKRLMDYGFHAPTMSFPVPGTLMIEPTESESKAELDRFIAAMISIRDEIRSIENGVMDKHDNPLKNAPHTAAMVCADQWPHKYSRQQAAYPLASLKANKYWPPVARIDNVYGDRNLMCSCQ